MPDVIQFKNGNQIKNTYDADGQKLGTEYFTQLTNITPLVDGQIISQSYIPGTVGQTGNAYIGNMEYNTQNGNSSLTALNRIYNDEGYVETPGNSQYYYYRKDHLGNNREVWLANTNTTKQWTQYYPSGLPLACSSSDNPGLQSRKYNGKEFIEMHGYDAYDYGARGMYPALDIMPTIDRFAEKYYSLSPYGFAAGNPINNIDINGDSLMFFKNGKYLRTIDNGKTEMTGYNQETTVDKNGKETFTGGQNFNFNDSEVDPQAIRNGAINMVEFVSDATVNNQINRSGVNNHKGIGYAYTESHAGGRMDYGYQGIEKFKDLNNHTFYVRSGTAYNVADYGNYLWGRGMALLGIDAGVASLGAHFNNFRSKLFGNTDYYSNYNFGKGTYGQPDWFDSPADQRAIIKGSQSVNRTYKPKPFAWPMNHFTLK